ncbi:MAG: hypothetical protein IH994_03335 [Proteobacteria bacterium]|nr:hypothetical protein [Pseudomonadota bacterium]
MEKRQEIRPRPGLAARWTLLALPLCYIAAALWVRSQGGPSWLWFNLDPDYFYLLDALNIVNLTTPGHVYHPGTTVEWLGALVLRAANPGASADAITGAVLADPETHLRLIGTVFIVLNALGVLVLGAVGWRVFGDLPAAAFLQLAPFISTVVLKHSIYVKPEALLLLTVLMLAAVAVLTLQPGLLERHKGRFAAAFGVIAGFGVASKITAVPVFLLPLFVLGGVRPRILYGVWALAALIVFTLPALGAYDVFFAWMAKVSHGTSAYGGAPGATDWGVYVKGILKLFKRPAFHVVFILSGLTLIGAWWRSRQGRPAPVPEVRLLAGIWVAQLAHVLLVAKQPNAIYMIPSFVLIPLALVLAWRLMSGMLADRPAAMRVLGPGLAVLLAALVAAQGYGVSKLGRQLGRDHKAALSIDNGRFERCARINLYASSNPSFALMLGDYVTGSRFSERLAVLRPANDYWLEHWWDQSRLVLRGWRGPEDITQVLNRYPCVVYRGTHWYRPPHRRILDLLMPKAVPGIKFDAICKAGKETIATAGVDCDGRAIP